ncbi:hypothetical protein ACWD25_27525 [Streptomyces sp. NPDC002920]
MRVRMKVDISGARNGEPWPVRGEITELPDDEAESLCISGMAVPVTDDDVEERPAADDDVETRALTTETAAAVTPSVPESKPAPAKKTAAKKTAASPAKD